ncbi:MAG: hypothetical protein A2860_04060 [Candidatus Levybacteria bacterium RIFCSPHIGHO2_01_FULL_37_33]|nr:MAG: hypothetical protein A2860_04060 [Candidatus Levybacteria bacterium RIFCSPHIGHO2_01_FULL_37_33]OGH16089.1 MAG: hypothetical protein A3C97_03495 [Candidatus Levybacteria bacterium RIFCSPHIGHO2_02_FULL_37_11]OGH30174.1 MAG: hypothetical protein A3F30_02375 [Candidatus Levybacteria bacterium RIFCSPHIGHO2_12_FULL_37_12]
MGRCPEYPVQRESEERPKTRIVVTGMGAITPLGLNVADFWKNLIAGKSGLSNIELPYTKIKVAGIIPDFKPEVSLSGLVPLKDIKRLSRPVQFSIAAAFEALLDAGLLNELRKISEKIDLTRFGTSIGTGIGGIVDILDVKTKLDRGEDVKPSDLFRSEPERVATAVSMIFGLKGPLQAPTAACATGNIAAANGFNEIRLGNADLMVVGGSEACLHGVTLSLFESANALSLKPDPNEASRPFDKARSGFVMSEGAGIYVLESLEHAKKRNARIYAEFLGYGNTADAFHDTTPSKDGQRRALRLAVRSIKDLDKHRIYINAHGTGTPPGDPVEISGIREEFSEIMDNVVGISSIKGGIGHTVGAAGAIESIACIKAINEGIIPPTRNLENQIEEADGVNLVPNDAQQTNGVDVVIKPSFGFGGINSVLVFKRFEE